MQTPELQNYKRLSLLLASILIANPVILYLLTDSLWITGVVFIVVVALVQGSYTLFRSKLPTVYLINFLAIISVFLHAEIVFENNFSDYVIEDLYTIEDGYYFNKPYLEKRFIDKEYTVDYLTNSQGFRVGYSQHLDETYEEVDWLFIGDSYTQGAQVDFEELYTTQLYRRFPDKIIANVGISGFGVVEEYKFYKNQGSTYKPDIVFLQLCSFNDFMKVYEKSIGFSDYLVHYSDFIRFLLQDIKYQNPAELPLGRWTEPFYPDEKSNRDFNVFYRESSEAKERDLENFEYYLSLLNDEVAKNGAELVVVLLPTKEQIRFKYLEEVINSFEIDPAKLDMTRPNRLVSRVADSLGIELIDLLDVFEESSREVYFSYDEHLNGYGHELLADVIADRILSRGLTSPPTILSTDYAGDRYPMYSPDGQFITYQSFTGGNTELFIADTLFTSIRRLTVNDVDEAHPMISTANDRIIFTEGDQESLMTNVGMANLNGSGRMILTEEEDVFGAIPSFSPDNDRIAYAEWFFDEATQTFTNPQIVVLDLRDGERKDITSPESESWRPFFSADGNRLVYISKVEGQFDLFLYDFETGMEDRLTETPYDEWDPQFSKDGAFVVYAAHADGNWDLFVLKLDTHQRFQLTSTIGDEWDPSFSIDDSKIIYAGEFGIFKGIYEIPFGIEAN